LKPGGAKVFGNGGADYGRDDSEQQNGDEHSLGRCDDQASKQRKHPGDATQGRAAVNSE
jgi:hypothetical protein